MYMRIGKPHGRARTPVGATREITPKTPRNPPKLARLPKRVDGTRGAGGFWRSAVIDGGGDMSTFQDWLARNVDRDDPIGDLAQDAQRDARYRPERYRDMPNTFDAWHNVLTMGMACSEAHETLRAAWAEYQAEGGES
jgi:hypothetical protein